MITTDARGRFDRDLEIIMRRAGVIRAAADLGFDYEETFGRLGESRDHQYRRYRWSVSVDEDGNKEIHAFPPEEEVGWTPWEIWALGPAGAVRKERVLGPDRCWQTTTSSEGELAPRFARPSDSLADKLQCYRVLAAANRLEFPIMSMVEKAPDRVRSNYLHRRWCVIDHPLSNFLPVVYAPPAMARSDIEPWESWYRDQSGELAHHIHYTRRSAGLAGPWTEGLSAPLRPPEILGLNWYWRDATILSFIDPNTGNELELS